MTVEYVIQDCDTHHKFDDAIECPFCEINRLRAERQDWLTRSKEMGRKLDDLTGTLERVRDLLPSRPHTAILIIDTVLSMTKLLLPRLAAAKNGENDAAT